jgi:hypothetical protein
MNGGGNNTDEEDDGTPASGELAPGSRVGE